MKTLAKINLIKVVLVSVLSLVSTQAVSHSQTPSLVNAVTPVDSKTVTITVANLNKYKASYDINIDGTQAGTLSLNGNEFRKINIKLDRRLKDNYNEISKRVVCSVSIPSHNENRFKTRICTNVNLVFVE